MMEIDGIKRRISEPLVMKSPSGYYVGVEYFDGAKNKWVPYDRFTDYYPTKGEAEVALKTFKSY